MRLYVKLTASVICLLFALFWPDTASAHEAAPDWIQELKNGDDAKCCGKDDCTPMESNDNAPSSQHSYDRMNVEMMDA